MRPKLIWATVFLVVALVAALSSFGWIVGTVGEIAKGLFFIFLIWSVVSYFDRRSTV